MSRSPYGVYHRPSSPAKSNSLRQSAPDAGVLAQDPDGTWGQAGAWPVSRSGSLPPRPPSGEPTPPSAGANKSPMAFRARRFNNSSGSASDASGELAPAPPNGAPSERTKRRASQEPGSGASAGSQPPIARQSSTASTGSAASGMSARPTTSQGILAAYSNGPGGAHGPLANGASRQMQQQTSIGGRPRSSGSVAGAGTGAAGGAANGTGGKMLKNRLSEEGKCHAVRRLWQRWASAQGHLQNMVQVEGGVGIGGGYGHCGCWG